MSAKVCVIADGRPGHVNQTLGALRMLKVPDLSISTVHVEVHRKYLKRPILLGFSLFSHLPRWLLSLAYERYYGQRPPRLDPDALIMSTGGDTLIANIVLARIHGLKNVFIGKRYRVAESNVSLVVTAGGVPIPGKVITLPFAPVYPEASAKLNIGREPGTMICAVLVGGDSQEYHYSETDYRTLAQALNQLCEQQRMHILITTSRRTGATGENILRSNLKQEYVAEATWYGDAPRPTSAAYCQESDLIMVTEDSGTMLTEALNFGKPLIAVSPAQVTLTPFYADFLDRVGAQGLHRCPISGVAEMDIHTLSSARPVDNRELVASIRTLLARDAPDPRPIPNAH